MNGATPTGRQSSGPYLGFTPPWWLRMLPGEDVEPPDTGLTIPDPYPPHPSDDEWRDMREAATRGLRAAAAPQSAPPPVITNPEPGVWQGSTPRTPGEQTAFGERGRRELADYNDVLDQNLYDARVRVALENRDPAMLQGLAAAQQGRPRLRTGTPALDALQAGDVGRTNTLRTAEMADDVYQAGRDMEWNKFVDLLDQQANPRYREHQTFLSRLRAGENLARGFGSGYGDPTLLGQLFGEEITDPAAMPPEENVVTQADVIEAARIANKTPEQVAEILRRHNYTVR